MNDGTLPRMGDGERGSGVEFGRRAFLGALGLIAVGGLTARSCGPQIRGRMVLVHGLNQNVAESRAGEPWQRFEEQFADRWELTIPEYEPYTSDTLTAAFEADPTGRTVRDEWVRRYDSTMLAEPPVGGLTVLVGLSWGGLLALHAATRGRYRPDAYVCVVPAASPSALAEFERFDLGVLGSFEESELAKIPGWIGWAEGDERVGSDVAVALARRVGAAGGAYPGPTHGLTDAMTADVATWVAGLG